MSLPSVVELFTKLSISKSATCGAWLVRPCTVRTTQQHMQFATKVTATKQKTSPEESPAPKRPVNSYLLFSKDYRVELQKKGSMPTLMKEFQPMCAAVWQNMNAFQKRKYEASYNQDKIRYNRELEVYKKTLPPQKPGKGLSAYNFFIADTVKRNPNIANTQAFKMAATRWSKMTPLEKGPYLTKSKQDVAVKAKQLATYNQLTGTPTDKPKRPTNAWTAFAGDYILRASKNTPAQGVNTVPPTKRMQEASEKWRSMDERQRAPFARRAAEAKQKYEREMAVWTAKQE